MSLADEITQKQETSLADKNDPDYVFLLTGSDSGYGFSNKSQPLGPGKVGHNGWTGEQQCEQTYFTELGCHQTERGFPFVIHNVVKTKVENPFLEGFFLTDLHVVLNMLHFVRRELKTSSQYASDVHADFPLGVEFFLFALLEVDRQAICLARVQLIHAEFTQCNSLCLKQQKKYASHCKICVQSVRGLNARQSCKASRQPVNTLCIHDHNFGLV